MEYKGVKSINELHLAASTGDLEFVEALFDTDIECDVPNEFGWTPLMQAVSFGQSYVVATLIARGANVNACNDLGVNTTAIACTQGDIKILKLLLEAGAIMEGCSKKQKLLLPSLLVAASHGYENVIKLLLEHGYSPGDLMGFSKASALHVATIGLHARIVQILLRAGANAKIKDAAMCSPFDLITSSPWSTDVVDKLGEQAESLRNVRELLRTNLEIELGEGWTEDVLNCAAKGNYQKMSKLLANLGSDPETIQLRQQVHAFTLNAAILKASTEGYQQIVSQLIAFGADVNCIQGDGRTPLMLAAINGHMSVTRMLLNAGANVFARCHITGLTTFELASLEERVPSELLRVLAHRTLIGEPHPTFQCTLLEQVAQPRTPQPTSRSTLLFPPSMKKMAKSLPGSPSYQKDILNFDSLYSPKKVTPGDLMAQLAEGSTSTISTPQKMRQWISRVTKK